MLVSGGLRFSMAVVTKVPTARGSLVANAATDCPKQPGGRNAAAEAGDAIPSIRTPPTPMMSASRFTEITPFLGAILSARSPVTQVRPAPGGTRLLLHALARIMGTSVRMIERHYGALLDVRRPISAGGLTRSTQSGIVPRSVLNRHERWLRSYGCASAVGADARTPTAWYLCGVLRVYQCWV
jgi:hypothetical protein